MSIAIELSDSILDLIAEGRRNNDPLAEEIGQAVDEALAVRDHPSHYDDHGYAMDDYAEADIVSLPKAHTVIDGGPAPVPDVAGRDISYSPPDYNAAAERARRANFERWLDRR